MYRSLRIEATASLRWQSNFSAASLFPSLINMGWKKRDACRTATRFSKKASQLSVRAV